MYPEGSSEPTGLGRIGWDGEGRRAGSGDANVLPAWQVASPLGLEATLLSGDELKTRG